VFVCSYFFNLDAAKAASGRFVSRYWGQLPALLADAGVASNWLHRFVPSDAAARIDEAAARIDSFHATETSRSHRLLESGLSRAVLCRVAVRWGRLLLASRLRAPEALFTPRGYQVSFWPIFREEWADAVRGREAVDALLSAACFDAVLGSLPRQTVGLYLCEGAWRKHGHGRILAVVHPALRFWDTRYFDDPRGVALGMPLPDCVVANGENARDLLRDAGLAEDRVVVAEALRYQYLAGMKPHVRAPGSALTVRRILILGDVLRDATHRLLKMLVEAVVPADGHLEFTLKPHPLCMVEASDYPSLRLALTNSPLGEILADYDLAYASNGTSAAVDAYLAGLPVVVQLDPGALNLSPLRGCDAAELVGTPAELRAALELSRRPVKSGEFFCLDPGLPRWRRLLGAGLSPAGIPS
jgi:surface carbohydrate biosynthesis protein (TIGR04326 family)